MNKPQYQKISRENKPANAIECGISNTLYNALINGKKAISGLSNKMKFICYSDYYDAS